MKNNKLLLPALILGVCFVIGCFLLAHSNRYMSFDEDNPHVFDKWTKRPVYTMNE